MKRSLATLLALVLLLSVFGSTVLATQSAVETDSDVVDETTTDVTVPTTGETTEKTVFSKYKYSDYIDDHKDVPYALGQQVTVNANTYLPTSTGVSPATDYEVQDAENFSAKGGVSGASVLTTEQSIVNWEVDIPVEGLYAINVLYYTVADKGSDGERSLSIDGEQPFTEAGALIYPRVWKDAGEFEKDIHDNDIRPQAQEIHGWYDIDARDASGNYGTRLYFYFTAGKHIVTFESEREAMVINRLTFFAPQSAISYQQYLAQYESSLGANAYPAGQSVTVQAEKSYSKSSTTLYAESDRANPATYPSSPDQIRLNKIDSSKFSSPYQWMTWRVEVPQAGLYKIVTRYQQSTKDGSFCNRTVKINGVVPFAEAEIVRFKYNSAWQVESLTNAATGDELYFYLNAGANDITLEVTLGEFGDILDRVDTVVYELNQYYREILMITGSTPDAYRDYNFPKLIPDTLKGLEKNSAEIKSIVADIEALVGESGSYTSSFKTLVQDIDTMTKDPQIIAKRLQNFKSNLGTISTWLLNATSQPVSLDWVMVASKDVELPKANKGFFANLWHQFLLFLASFYMDYDEVGLREDSSSADQEEITVWVTTSLDQSQIIRTLIDNNRQDLTSKVNLQLVAAATVLPSIAAGTGPDVVLGVAATDPINYAIRGAVVDMSQFEGFDDVLKRYENEQITRPYQYKGKTYGLPETFAFPMLFYREDILSELEIEVPDTWDEVYDCIVKLNMNSMQFGIPSAITTYGTLLYQNGGAFYEELGNGQAVSALTPETGAVEIFRQWTEFFSAYDCLVTYDFANRFRTGETPIGIADYTQYNQLSVFAPEIKGLWSFTKVPGVDKDKDGNPDSQLTLASGTASVILKTSKHQEKAWDFLNWWTSTDIQVAYGREIESILGTASRYNTANKAAAAQLPWSTKDFNAISAAWEDAMALPEYPGSYIFSRYVNFAFLEVVNNQADPGEELLDYVKMIDEELKRKQAEFASVE